MISSASIKFYHIDYYESSSLWASGKCWTWAGSPTWARLNPAHMPKEVKAVVLETTALNCSCTLNVHERYGDWLYKRNVLMKTKKIRYLHGKSKSVRIVESIPVLVIGVTH